MGVSQKCSIFAAEKGVQPIKRKYLKLHISSMLLSK